LAELKELALAAAPVEEPAPSPVKSLLGVLAHAAPSAPAGDAARQPVRSIRAGAYLSNWDGGVLQDGLVVEVQPITRGGGMAAVDGTLEVELFAPQIRRFQDAPRNRGATLEPIGRWTMAVSAADFTARGFAAELPFQAIQPQTDQNILPWGMVHVKLSVPGDGVFETTLEYVRVRPWAPLRDFYGLHQNRRFLPTERK
jgi:hypothetical protein